MAKKRKKPDAPKPDTSPIQPKQLARSSDPETSKLAAQNIVKHLGPLHKFALECVTSTPGLTQRELGVKHCPLDDSRKIGRRLNELARAGKILRGEKRLCSITGRPAEQWYPLSYPPPPPSGFELFKDQE